MASSNQTATAQGLHSTWTTPDRKYVTGLRELIRAKKVDALLSDLSANATMSLQWLFEHWAHDHQLPPEGMWKTWVVMGGRGAGKTRAGAEWIRSQAEGSTAKAKGRARRIALVAETLDQARDIMVLGESGIVACSPPDRRPLWQASRRRLVWPNGAEAQVFSASDPDSLRGPQFDCAWVDELAKWKNGRAAWNMLQFGLRLGDNPRQVVTTTPRSNQLLKDVLSHDTTVTTSAPSSANRAYLAPGFLEHIEAMYGGTRLGREEIDGTLIDDVEGALWRLDAIDRSRVDIKPDLDRIVVAVDPPVTSGSKADACGIVVVGATLKGGPQDWAAYVLEDGSVEGHTPAQWAQHAVRLYHRYGADRIVAEVNQGGDLVETVCRMIDPHISYKAVRASRGKVARAEPAAALYEQGRVHHCVPCTELEDQMCQVTHSGYVGPGSPDRVDALVWALTDLIIERSARQSTPQIRFF